MEKKCLRKSCKSPTCPHPECNPRLFARVRGRSRRTTSAPDLGDARNYLFILPQYFVYVWCCHFMGICTYAVWTAYFQVRKVSWSQKQGDVSAPNNSSDTNVFLSDCSGAQMEGNGFRHSFDFNAYLWLHVISITLVICKIPFYNNPILNLRPILKFNFGFN